MSFISGLYNCHLPGLHSYVLRDRLDPLIGMVRIFHTVLDMPLFGGGDFWVKPHDHRQGIQITPLRGTMRNWIVKEGSIAPDATTGRCRPPRGSNQRKL